MVHGRNLWSRLYKYNIYLFIKLGVSILLLGFAYRFLFSSSTGFLLITNTLSENATQYPQSDAPFESTRFSQVPDPLTISSNGVLQVLDPPSESPNGVLQVSDPPSENPVGFSHISVSPAESPNALPPNIFTGNIDEIPQDNTTQACDIFDGEWVPSKSEPLYTSETCSFIDDAQNCIKNGRPDNGYLHWRWKPHGCELPRFNPKTFLESMNDKDWTVVGDSLSRNQVQSLLCMLSTVDKAVMIYHDENFQTKKWLFPTFNFTISLIWSPLLAKAIIFEDLNGVSSSEIELHMDTLDNSWIEPYKNADYVTFSTGAWFWKSALYYENNTIIGCHNCPKRNVTEVGFTFAYQKVLRNVFNYIVASNHKGVIFYRTSTPIHFDNNEWYNGGTCNKTFPAKEGELQLKDHEKVIRDTEIEEFNRASKNSVNLKLFDVTNLSLLRPDGHPGLYRNSRKLVKGDSGKVISDCLHWCVPGPIDYWNDLLMEMVVNG